MALLNALLHEVIRTDRIDRDHLDTHTVGFAELAAQVEQCTPRWAARICDVPAASIEHAAEIIGGAERLLSTVLQGVYQSHQATAAAVQVNNLHLVRGMLGRPETGLLLLYDLRELHLAATRNSLHWEMLAQAAQATSDDRLLGLAGSWHPRTLRQMRWTNTMIKELSPQLLASA
ncbi:hypothetical protein ACFWWT_31150 [Streptomyces sp. NPDC058676]|uniref:hypothetical protein n=1 Tax=unclassified Streptomyces TaxID=2593676 RepID=UPI0036616AC7